MAVQKLGTLLGTAGEFQTLMQKARRLSHWQARYSEAAPPALARASRVAGFRAGTLVLWADNAAVAAKLKQVTPRLMTALNRQADEVTSIRVQVQPAGVIAREKKNRARSGLSEHALAAFEQLRGTVPDSPLKHAVEALVAHHRRKP